MSLGSTAPRPGYPLRRQRAFRHDAPTQAQPAPKADVLDIVTILLVVTWLLGLAAGYTAQGAIHLLLALAVASTGLRWALARRS